MEFISRSKSAALVKRSKKANPCDWEGDTDFDRGSVEANLFEQEMDAEFKSRAFKAEVESGLTRSDSKQDLNAPGPSGTSSNKAIESEGAFYDRIYFDSDEEDDTPMEEREQQVKASSAHRKVLTNDDLMYDPDMDTEDQAWVDNIRKQYQTKSKRRAMEQEGTNLEQASTSGAVLNCPACFSVLCLDCQRHELYKHQYRAMFVMNCRIDHEETLKFPKSKKKKKTEQRKKKSKNLDSAIEDEELYSSVRCVKCSTQVAVFDKEEVYHFFNVVSSHS